MKPSKIAVRPIANIAVATIVICRMSHAVNFSNAHQLQASDPYRHIWVAASAGSGKTKVLTDRVLRLLLEGTQPSKILCLTYTKAAATEMQTRIQETLSRWVMLPDDTLDTHIQAITGERPSEKMRKRARTLFASLLEINPPLRIQTIHAFCQSVLGRFPLEANVPPSFDILDERSSSEMLHTAQRWLLSIGLDPEPQPHHALLKEALVTFSSGLDEGKFNDILKGIINERRHIESLLTTLHDNFDDELSRLHYIRTCLVQHVGLDPDLRDESCIYERHFQLNHTQLAQLEGLRDTLQAIGSKSDLTALDYLKDFLRLRLTHPAQAADSYECIWLTDKGEPRANVVTKKIFGELNYLNDLIRSETQRVQAYREAIRALQTVQDATYLFIIAHALFERYHQMKQARGLLDYEDLIFATRKLLCSKDMIPWVLFKLDGGIDHILVDEAQDTAPIQWELVCALVDEFFSGDTAFSPTPERPERTLFVVGDEKQSIYRFQGADVQTFTATREHLQQHLRARSFALEEVRLAVSYRSTPAILEAVDAVFAGDHARRGLGDPTQDISHSAFKAAKAGSVELWPIVRVEKSKKDDAIAMLGAPSDHVTSELVLAQRIARTIAHWLHSKRPLLAQNRPLHAGDILILVRRRNHFVHLLSRELKRNNVPIAGLDRMELTEHIAVQDMLALAQFLLLPDDDLTLAGLLKSPLYGVDEEALFILCYGRGKDSLWQRVQHYEGDNTTVVAAREELTALLNKTDFTTPYALFAELLYGRHGRERMMARMGDEVLDPLHVFLGEAMRYEQLHAPSLQGFLEWITSGENSVKRDMEQGMEAVRIMTVHGSKGLQAPIVILPDTTALPNDAHDIVIDHHAAGHPLLFLSYAKEQACERIRTIKRHNEQQADEEYHRLLYVALTRAEEELIVCGYEKHHKRKETCWYELVNDGTKRLTDVQSLSTTEHFPWWNVEDETVLRYATFQPPSTNIVEARPAVANTPHQLLPAWATSSAPHEPTPPRPLAPSHLLEDEPVTIIPTSPMEARNTALPPSIEYGTLVHRLLHVLSNCEAETRPALAAQYLARQLPDMPSPRREQLIREVLQVMNEPQFAPIFGAGSLAEVPVTGVTSDTRVIAGRVDRLVVTQDKVLIVDFKTGKPPAANEEHPKRYLEQMRAYKDVLQHIYPTHTTSCALIYTSVPVLMPLDI